MVEWTKQAFSVTTEPQRPHLAPRVSVSITMSVSNAPNTSGFLITGISMICCKVFLTALYSAHTFMLPHIQHLILKQFQQDLKPKKKKSEDTVLKVEAKGTFFF